MNFQLSQHNCIQRLDDGVFIPCDPANADYQAYLAWVDEGNTPEPPPPVVSPPALTTEEKLMAAGLTVAELKQLFGLT